MKVPISVRTSYNKADLQCLVDSGATNNFIHPRFVRRMKLGTRELARPKKLYNINDTTNKAGNVTHYVDLIVETAGRKKEMRFLVSNVGQEDAILGYPWLATFEPKFSWAHGTIDVKNLPIVLRSINPTQEHSTIARVVKEEIVSQLTEECGARGASTDLAIKAHDEQRKITILPEYKRFTSVFSDEESQRFPPPRPWDHAIELKPDTPSHLRCKVYPMTREEDTALDKFINEQLLKGYIEPSKSPYASPFFFVKKEGRKATTRTGLSGPQRVDSEEPISPTIDTSTHPRPWGSIRLLQVRRAMGV